jgi:hypothetical protein
MNYDYGHGLRLLLLPWILLGLLRHTNHFAAFYRHSLSPSTPTPSLQESICLSAGLSLPGFPSPLAGARLTHDDTSLPYPTYTFACVFVCLWPTTLPAMLCTLRSLPVVARAAA